MSATPQSNANEETISFTLNGQSVEAWKDETLLQTAKRIGVEIPHLCYEEEYRPDGNCRACSVEIGGERVLAAACCRKPIERMKIISNSTRALTSPKMVLELLLSDMPQLQCDG